MIETLRPSFFICSNSYFGLGEMWWSQARGSLGCGYLSYFSSRRNAHQDFSLHLLNATNQELQRGQRELPSGQSLHFSPYTLPCGHTAWLPEKEYKLHQEAIRVGWKPGGPATSVGKEPSGPTFLQND